MPEQQDTQQATNTETSPQETAAPVQAEAPQTEQSVQTATQPETKVQPEVQPTSKRTHNDRIADLESKIARMEAIYQLQGQNVVDMEVCADLLLKGYTIEQLKQSKPYLFGSSAQAAPATPATSPGLGVVRQPQKVVAAAQPPKSSVPSVSSEGFVKSLADMLISKF